MTDLSDALRRRLEIAKGYSYLNLSHFFPKPIPPIPPANQFAIGTTYFCQNLPPWERVDNDPVAFIPDQVIFPPVGAKILMDANFATTGAKTVREVKLSLNIVTNELHVFVLMGQ